MHIRLLCAVVAVVVGVTRGSAQIPDMSMSYHYQLGTFAPVNTSKNGSEWESVVVSSNFEGVCWTINTVFVWLILSLCLFLFWMYSCVSCCDGTSGEPNQPKALKRKKLVLVKPRKVDPKKEANEDQLKAAEEGHSDGKGEEDGNQTPNQQQPALREEDPKIYDCV